ncbi:MAG: AlwI family type II restriction endonuclease [Victivallales bacterium]|nr:AlwI family type II restriction endonuclease [Victivallales bacterium]
MARLGSRFLFFTTSPRTPAKMIPEIQLLADRFGGKTWNNQTQNEFITALGESSFFEGTGSPSDKAFSVRDRINRAPKALGFIDLTPKIALTDAGRAFIYGKRPQEAFLRQLLKFQLPSPFHIEDKSILGTFYVRPYLEILRLIRQLEYLTFDELKIFALQLTDYRKFDDIAASIRKFRKDKAKYQGNYKQFADTIWTESIKRLYHDDIQVGKTKTRETTDSSLDKFIKTKKSNARDYADACFRYLRYTGLLSLEQKSRRLQFYADKLQDIDHILATVSREPVFVSDEKKYKAHLFCSETPVLYDDSKDNLIVFLQGKGVSSREELMKKNIEELKDLRDSILQKQLDDVILTQIQQLKTFSLYSEIIDTFKELLDHDIYYDAPLMLEYNTWRAMTMLDGGTIKANLKFDDAGQPLSTAQGNMPDIECDYGDFVLSVEVTMQHGQRQYETEGEPVARHYGQFKQSTGKNAYCLFIAPTINPAAFMHFYGLNKLNNVYYGGKTKIIPIGITQFMKLLSNSFQYLATHKCAPTPKEIKSFLDSVLAKLDVCQDENSWKDFIQQSVNQWLI